MESMTKQQAKLLDFIRSEIKTKRVAPSFDEMREHMGLKSKSGIHRLVQGLVSRGQIYIPFNGRRRISLTGKQDMARFTADELLEELTSRGFAVNGKRK